MPYRNSTLTAENASMLRRYWPHVWSTVGSMPVTLKMPRSTFQCLSVVKILAM